MSGWDAAATVSEEIDDPVRTMPKALALACFGTYMQFVLVFASFSIANVMHWQLWEEFELVSIVKLILLPQYAPNGDLLPVEAEEQQGGEDDRTTRANLARASARTSEPGETPSGTGSSSIQIINSTAALALQDDSTPSSSSTPSGLGKSGRADAASAAVTGDSTGEVLEDGTVKAVASTPVIDVVAAQTTVRTDRFLSQEVSASLLHQDENLQQEAVKRKSKEEDDAAPLTGERRGGSRNGSEDDQAAKTSNDTAKKSKKWYFWLITLLISATVICGNSGLYAAELICSAYQLKGLVNEGILPRWTGLGYLYDCCFPH